jgi:hypothetical protein
MRREMRSSKIIRALDDARANVLHRNNEKYLYIRGVREKKRMKLKSEIKTAHDNIKTKRALKVVCNNKRGLVCKLPDDVVVSLFEWF